MQNNQPVSNIRGIVTNTLLFYIVRGALNTIPDIRNLDPVKISNMVKDRIKYHLNSSISTTKKI